MSQLEEEIKEEKNQRMLMEGEIKELKEFVLTLRQKSEENQKQNIVFEERLKEEGKNREQIEKQLVEQKGMLVSMRKEEELEKKVGDEMEVVHEDNLNKQMRHS